MATELGHRLVLSWKWGGAGGGGGESPDMTKNVVLEPTEAAERCGVPLPGERPQASQGPCGEGVRAGVTDSAPWAPRAVGGRFADGTSNFGVRGSRLTGPRASLCSRRGTEAPRGFLGWASFRAAI